MCVDFYSVLPQYCRTAISQTDSTRIYSQCANDRKNNVIAHSLSDCRITISQLVSIVADATEIKFLLVQI